MPTYVSMYVCTECSALTAVEFITAIWVFPIPITILDVTVHCCISTEKLKHPVIYNPIIICIVILSLFLQSQFYQVCMMMMKGRSVQQLHKRLKFENGSPTTIFSLCVQTLVCKEKSQYQDTICNEAEEGLGDRQKCFAAQRGDLMGFFTSGKKKTILNPLAFSGIAKHILQHYFGNLCHLVVIPWSNMCVC